MKERFPPRSPESTNFPLTEKVERKISENEKRAQRIQEKARNVVTIATKAAMVLGLAATLNHVRTRNHIEVHEQNGEKVYEHPDERTTAIINFITDHAALSEQEKIYFYRELVREKYDSRLMKVPDHLNSLNQEQLREALAEWHQKDFFEENVSREQGLKLAEQEFADAVASPAKGLDSKIYTLVWELQRKVGAPKVRWSVEGEDVVSEIMSKTSGEGRAFYNPFSNTVYITPAKPAELLAEEDSHAYQFDTKPVSSYEKLAATWVSASTRSVTHFQNIQASYQKEYERPGSIEYEAHTQLTPKLLNEVINDTFKDKGTH